LPEWQVFRIFNHLREHLSSPQSTPITSSIRDSRQCSHSTLMEGNLKYYPLACLTEALPKGALLQASTTPSSCLVHGLSSNNNNVSRED